jgi:membrane protein YdbS with pleckstrin-like domain
VFENPEITLDRLPSADDVEWRSLSPRYIRRLQVQSLITMSVAVAGLVVLQAAPLPITGRWLFGAAWLLISAGAVAGVCWPLLAVPRKGFAIRDRDILYRSGVLWRSITAVPFNRVQHVETSSTPLDRHFELAALQLFTAGGTGGDLKIRGMPADAAESLRLFILEKAGVSEARIEHH